VVEDYGLQIDRNSDFGGVVESHDQFAIIDHDRYYTRFTKSLYKQLFLFTYRPNLPRRKDLLPV
jgi:hypothetical protein